jgi:hypothetical protein
VSGPAFSSETDPILDQGCSNPSSSDQESINWVGGGVGVWKKADGEGLVYVALNCMALLGIWESYPEVLSGQDVSMYSTLFT